MGRCLATAMGTARASVPPHPFLLTSIGVGLRRGALPEIAHAIASARTIHLPKHSLRRNLLEFGLLRALVGLAHAPARGKEPGSAVCRPPVAVLPSAVPQEMAQRRPDATVAFAAVPRLCFSAWG